MGIGTGGTFRRGSQEALRGDRKELELVAIVAAGMALARAGLGLSRTSTTSKGAASRESRFARSRSRPRHSRCRSGDAARPAHGHLGQALVALCGRRQGGRGRARLHRRARQLRVRGPTGAGATPAAKAPAPDGPGGRLQPGRADQVHPARVASLQFLLAFEDAGWRVHQSLVQRPLSTGQRRGERRPTARPFGGASRAVCDSTT
jgi:hypothetical protein